MDFLKGIGDFFNGIMNPIDMLVGMLVKIAFEVTSFFLGQIVSLMKLNTTFSEISAVTTMFSLINLLCIILSFGIATYFVFNNLFKMWIGQDAKTPRQVVGTIIDYGWKLLSMPFFLFTFLKVNNLVISVLTKMGLDPTTVSKALGVGGNTPGDMLKKMIALFAVPGSTIFIAPMLAITLAVCFFVLNYQLTIRSGELVFIYLFIPVVALSTMTEDLNLYSTWWRQVITVVGGQICQIVGLYLFLQCMVEGHGIIGSGILIATIKTPGLMKEYAINSGFTNGMKQISSTLMLKLAM